MAIVEGYQTIFFKIPFCPRCKTVEKSLEEISDEIPDISVKKLNFLTHIGRALNHELTTVPALIVNGELSNVL